MALNVQQALHQAGYTVRDEWLREALPQLNTPPASAAPRTLQLLSATPIASFCTPRGTLPANVATQHGVVIDNVVLEIKAVCETGVAAFEMLERIQLIKDHEESSAYEKLRKTKQGTSIQNSANANQPPLTVQSITAKLPREMLSWTLTDGVQDVTAIELDPVREFSLATPIGAKVHIKNAKLKRGILHLKPNNIRLILSTHPDAPKQTTDPKLFLNYLMRLFEAVLKQRNDNNHLYPSDNLPPSPTFGAANRDQNRAFDDFAGGDNYNAPAARGGARGRGRGGARGAGRGGATAGSTRGRGRGRGGARGGGAGGRDVSPPYQRDDVEMGDGNVGGGNVGSGSGRPVQQQQPMHMPRYANVGYPQQLNLNGGVPATIPASYSDTFSDDEDDFEMGELMDTALAQYERDGNAMGQDVGRPPRDMGMEEEEEDEFGDVDESLFDEVLLDGVYESQMKLEGGVGVGGNVLGEGVVWKPEGPGLAVKEEGGDAFLEVKRDGGRVLQESMGSRRVENQSASVGGLGGVVKTEKGISAVELRKKDVVFCCRIGGMAGSCVVQGIFYEIRIEVASRRLLALIEDGTLVLTCVVGDNVGPGWDDLQALASWKARFMQHEVRVLLELGHDVPRIVALQIV
ncbi:hypothetical protein HDU98_003456 [Podochytrium sp. JEL0797]|nr:hypothetical protein HDU98_003456 [Podochytrium sp. JEL0797]